MRRYCGNILANIEFAKKRGSDIDHHWWTYNVEMISSDHDLYECQIRLNKEERQAADHENSFEAYDIVMKAALDMAEEDGDEIINCAEVDKNDDWKILRMLPLSPEEVEKSRRSSISVLIIIAAFIIFSAVIYNIR